MSSSSITDLPSGGAASRRPAPSIAIVVPCYNEEDVLAALFARLAEISTDLAQKGAITGAATLILVDDGSADATWDIISQSHPGLRIKSVRLSRNHGHQHALLAGLSQSDADVTISMDADLQDDPAVVIDMVDAYREGAEIVFGIRNARSTDTVFKRTTALAFYRLLSILGVDVVPNHADYRLMSRKALRALDSFSERNLFLRGLIPQLGFQTADVYYDRNARLAGESKYPFRRMMALAIEGITSFTIKPLRMITALGFITSVIALILIIYTAWAWMAGKTVAGWSSVMVSIYFLGGLHLIALGIIGEYVGKIYLETKSRPRFIIDEIQDHAPELEAVKPIELAVAKK